MKLTRHNGRAGKIRESDKENDYSFEKIEQIYYFEHCADHIQAQNERNEKTRHTMSIEQLSALPVPELVAEDSALFLWATFPKLPEPCRAQSGDR